jgi:hypothetical protein
MTDIEWKAALDNYGAERGRLAHQALADGSVADHDYYRHGQLAAQAGTMHWTEREWRDPETAFRWQSVVAEATRRYVLVSVTPGRMPLLSGATAGLGPAAERAAARGTQF